MDDLIQWIALCVILLIIILVMVKRIVRFRRALRDGKGTGCSCEGCDKNCQFADKTNIEDGK